MARFKLADERQWKLAFKFETGGLDFQSWGSAEIDCFLIAGRYFSYLAGLWDCCLMRCCYEYGGIQLHATGIDWPVGW